MQTASGRQFWPLDPRPEEIVIEDIAHALALQCRFAGHCREPYSVAQHSVLVSRACDPRDALWGLLHDASEAYLQDMIRPLKRSPGFADRYLEAEVRLQAVICDRFGLPCEEPASVHRADVAVLLAEARDLLAPPPATWKEAQRGSDNVRAIEEPIIPWRWEAARHLFLVRFAELGGAL